MEEQERYLQGIQYQIDSFRASVETLANDTMSSDFLKGAISSARELVDVLDIILDKLGAVPVLAGAIGTALSAKGIGISGKKLQSDFDFLKTGVKSSAESLLTVITEQDKTSLMQFNQLLNESYSFTEAFDAAMTGASESAQEFARSFENIDKGTRDVYQEFVKFTDANNELNIAQLASTHSLSNNAQLIEYYNKNISGSTEASEAYTKALNTNNHSLAAYIASLNGAKGSLMGYIEFAGLATLKTIAFQAAAMAMQMVLSMLVAFIVTKVISAINDYIHRNEKLIEVANEAKQTIDELNTSLEKQKKTISDSAKRFAELSQGVDQLTGKNISLSDENYKEFLDISNELAEVFPSLSRHYDENGNAIVDLDGDVQTIVDSLEHMLQVEEQLAKEKILEKIPDLYKGAFAQVSENGLDAEISSLQTSLNSLEELTQFKLDDFQWSGIFTDSNVETIDKIERKLVDLNVAYQRLGKDKIQIAPELINDDVLNSIRDILNSYGDAYGEYSNELVQKINEKNKFISEAMANNIATQLSDDSAYQGMSEELKVVTQQIIQNLDWTELQKQFGDNWELTWAEIKKTIIDTLSGDEDAQYQIKLAFEAQTKFNNGDITVSEYQERIQQILPLLEGLDDKVVKSIKLILGIEEDDETVIAAANNVQNQFEKALEGKNAKFTAAELVGKLTKDTLDSLQDSDINWEEVLNLDDLETSVYAVEKAARKISEVPFEINFQKDSIKTATDGAKEIQSVYQTLYKSMEEGKQGVDLAFLISDIDDLGDKLKDADGNLLVSEKTWNDFFNTMTDGNHSFNEMEAALNQVLSEYVNASINLENFDAKQAKAISTQLQLAGVTKESADEFVSAKTREASAVQEAVDAGYKMISITADEIVALQEEKGWSEETAQAVAIYALKKQIANGLVINTSADILNLQKLAEAAGVTARYLSLVIEAKAKLANDQRLIDSGNLEGADLTKAINDANLQRKRIKELTELSEKDLQNQLSKLATTQAKGLVQDVDKIRSNGASKSAGKEVDIWKEAYEKELAELDHLHEMELISDVEYYEEKNRLNEKYFANSEKYAEDYQKNQEDIYKGLKAAYQTYLDDNLDYYKKSLDAGIMSLQEYSTKAKGMLEDLFAQGKISSQTYNEKMADVIGEILTQYDMAINSVQRNIDKQIKELEREKKALSKDYENRKKDIQSQIDEVQKLIDARNDEIESINDVIDGKNKQIKALNKEIKAKNKQIDAVNKEIKAKNKQIEELNAQVKVKNKEIDSINKEIKVRNKIIDGFQKQIDVIQDEIDVYQKEIDKLNEANKERQAAIEYQKALYELERAQNQRTSLVYNSEKGFVYEANDQDIKAAQEQLENLKHEQAVAVLEKKISNLQDSIDVLNEKIESVQDEIDGLNDRIEVLQDDIEILNERIEAIQDEIDELNKIIEAWQEEIDAINERIEALQDEIELLDEQIEGLEDEIENLEEVIDGFEDKINELETELDGLVAKIDEQITKCEEYKEAWGEVSNKFKESQEDMAAAALWGSNYINDIRNQDMQLLATATQDYINLQKDQVNAIQAAAADKAKAYAEMERALNSWKAAQAASEQTSGNYSTSSSNSVSGMKASGINGGTIKTPTTSKSNNNSNPAKQYTPKTNYAATKINQQAKANNDKLAAHYKYGIGTKNAEEGIHEVAETGDEIIRDNYGNAYLAEGHQLHRFEGGERVYSPTETQELLKGKYVPIDSLIPNYADMVAKMTSSNISSFGNVSNLNVPGYKGIPSSTTDKSISVTIGDIHVTEVDNAKQLATAITNNLPTALLQELTRK